MGPDDCRVAMDYRPQPEDLTVLQYFAYHDAQGMLGIISGEDLNEAWRTVAAMVAAGELPPEAWEYRLEQRIRPDDLAGE